LNLQLQDYYYNYPLFFLGAWKLNLFKKIWLALCLSIIFCSSSSFSKEEQEDILYIDAGIFNLDSTIPPPPIPSSFEYKLEVEFMKNRISKLSDAQKELAIKDALNESVGFFSDTLPGFDITKLPKTKSLFDKVKYNAGYEARSFKNYFKTKRPYQVDSDIQVCVAPKPSNLDRSYPSGHTTMGYAMGVVLANLVPEKAKEIMERARLYGENRINCGAHFPSDVSGGQVLGTLVAKELLKSNEFQLLMKASKEELASAGLTH
jgi:acid phosphatase (class A)